MSASSPNAAPAPKTPMPPLDARAPRPVVVRLRRGVVVGAVMAGVTLVGGSLAWAFVVQPELRDRARAARVDTRPNDARGVVRPSEKVTGGPADYADLDRLPAPRTFGAAPDAPAAAAPRARTPEPRARRRPVPDAALAADARSSDLFFASARGAPATPPPLEGALAAPAGDAAQVYNGHRLKAPLSPYEVKAGAIVPAVLLTAVDTTREGPVTASISEAIYDTVSGRHLLIPQGARLVGRHDGESRHGDDRAFITWERLILPNGKSLVLGKEPGVDAQGAIGVDGKVDRRIGPLVVASLFAGAITTLGQAARDRDDRGRGWLGDAGDAASVEAAQVGGKLIDRELEVRPTIRLRPGARVRVFITRDLILEPYRP